MFGWKIRFDPSALLGTSCFSKLNIKNLMSWLSKFFIVKLSKKSIFCHKHCGNTSVFLFQYFVVSKFWAVLGHYSPKGTIVCVERKKMRFLPSSFLCWQVKMDGSTSIASPLLFQTDKSITNFELLQNLNKTFHCQKTGHWVMIYHSLPAKKDGKG